MTAGTRAALPKRLSIVVAVLSVAILAAFGYRLLHPPLSTLLLEASAALQAGDALTAIDKTRQVVSRAPESVEGWILMAQAGVLAKDRNTWEPALARIERSSPGEAAALWVEIGGREMRGLRAATAEYALRRSTAIAPDRPEAWRLLAQLVSVQGRPRETAECLLALIRLRDFTSGDLHTLAWPNSAIDDSSRVTALLETDPQNLVPMLARVGSALNENHTADAERHLKTILARHSDNSRAAALLGKLLAERDAPEFLRWQRELAPHAVVEPEAWIAQGIWLRNHGQASAAARCFHRAVELDPRHLNALSELGQTMQALGESSLAASFLEWARLQQEITELAKRLNENGEPQNMRQLTERLEQVGRIWEAWAWCRVYLHSYPQDTAAAKDLARLQSQLTPDLPRTATEAVPGRDFNWSRLSEPDWSRVETAPISSESSSTDAALAFDDDAARLGIDFHFENGPANGRTLVQTSGGGVAAFDYDRDGWCDLYFTQGGHDLSAPTQTVTDALYRNNGSRGFQIVTRQAAIHEDGFSQGVAAGDVDNDGFADLYICNLGRNRLLRNQGDGTFADVTIASGLESTGWTISGAIADLNRDAQPDLFSVRYAGGPEIISRVCRDQTGRPGVCRPTLFPAEADLVAINSGDGRYTELCAEAGLDLPEGRGFGLVVADFNGDRRLDVFVANDQTANYLLIQEEADEGQLRFSDEAIVSGVAFDRDGFPQACMGVASGDINQDGRPDLFVTNFASESDTLYVSQPYGGYLDMTREARLRDPSFQPLGFGTQFLDADLDSRLDLVVLNGHINDTSDIGVSPAMLPQLYRGLAGGRFAEVLTDDADEFFNRPRVGRGLCVLDWNRDGLPDFAGSFLDGKAVLATNRSTPVGHWLAMEFVGVRSSRDAIGTRVRLVFSDGTERFWQATAGDGFAASNERRMNLGLGSHARVALVEIEWPSGLSQRFTDLRGDALWVAIEGHSQPCELLR